MKNYISAVSNSARSGYASACQHASFGGLSACCRSALARSRFAQRLSGRSFAGSHGETNRAHPADKLKAEAKGRSVLKGAKRRADKRRPKAAACLSARK